MQLSGDPKNKSKTNGMSTAGLPTGGPVGAARSAGAAGVGGAAGGNGPQVGVSLTGGAAVVAPVTAFPHGVPGNALVLLPLTKPTDDLLNLLKQGPVAVTPEQMWKLLGFNGPAVQVQDDQGRPIAIGRDDLLAGLEKHWQQEPDDMNRGRIYAQELMKYGLLDKAEQALGRLVASGEATGEDWLALGVTQLQGKKFDKAEGTLKGAQNLMPDNPLPSLHLARVAHEKERPEEERELIRRAISIDRRSVDAWAQYFHFVRELEGEEKAIQTLEGEASAAADKKNAAPYIAIQGFFAANEETRDKAVQWAKKAVDTNPDDPLALVVLSALYGQTGDLHAVIDLLQPHEPRMMRDVRLANNYFEALFQDRQIDKVTKLLNALAGSPERQVKQFAVERSRAVAQYLQQQQQQLVGAARPPAPAGTGGGRQS